jgi:hypothetical protein
MDERQDSLTEDQARSLWSRAAELQQRAAEAVAPTIGDEPGGEPTVSLDIAREAAVQSGIDGRYVDQALRQVRMDQELDSRAGATRWARALRASDGTLSERIHLDAPPAEVKNAVAAVAQSAPFAVELLNVLEPDQNASAYVYEVPEGSGGSGTFHHQVRDMSDVKRVAIIVSASPEGGADVELYCKLDNSVLVNGIALRVFQAVGVGLGAGLGGALASLIGRMTGLDSTVTLPMIQGAIAVVCGLGAGALTGRAYRVFYRRGLAKVRESFRKMLLTVRMRIDNDKRLTERQSP